MNTFAEWQRHYPEAARALSAALTDTSAPLPPEAHGKSEGWSQQRARFRAAEQGAAAWRNNVGATPAHCPDCGTQRQPVRYGLANDSQNLNAVLKSSDLILAIPRTITADMVGQRIAQFGSVETKRPGWTYSGNDREVAQLAWLALVEDLGGYARFSTGELEL